MEVNIGLLKNSEHFARGMSKVKTARALPSKRLCKIVSNYTRRGKSKLISAKRHPEKLDGYASFDEFSENNYTQSPSEEILLNSVRTSPPKAEISTISEKTTANDEVALLKKQLSAEKVKYAILEQSYKELMDLHTSSEIAYKTRLFELQNNNQETEESRFVLRSEFDLIAQRVCVLENSCFRNIK